MREKQNYIEEFWTQPESRRLEFKEQFPGGKQLAKTSVTFPNGVGGKIVFGVRNDPREIVGIVNDKLFKLEERIANHSVKGWWTGQVPDKYRTRIVQNADKIKLLKYCREARLLKEMMSFMKLKHRETFMNNYLRPLLEANCITMTIPDKPKSPSQRYIITQAGEALLNK